MTRLSLKHFTFNIVAVFLFRYGGCWGEGDIRKLAYFESSVDTAYATGNVSLLLFIFESLNLLVVLGIYKQFLGILFYFTINIFNIYSKPKGFRF